MREVAQSWLDQRAALSLQIRALRTKLAKLQREVDGQSMLKVFKLRAMIRRLEGEMQQGELRLR